jgi:phosphohistidine phosphatase
MKTVFFVRHAKSSWENPSLRDIERPLNQRGLRDAPFMAKLLRGKGVTPDRLLSSPAKRAMATAAFFAEAFDIDETDIESRAEIYEAFPETLLDIIRTFPAAWSNVLIFGHNPTFTSLVNLFSNRYIANVPTCGIVEVGAAIDDWRDFAPRTGKIANYYYPKQFFN